MYKNFTNLDGMFVADDLVDCFGQIGLESLDTVFEFKSGQQLNKANMASYRQRIAFQAGERTFYLKRYICPPIRIQVKNWISHGKRRLTSEYDCQPSFELEKIAIATPVISAFGGQWNGLFEKRSFVITEQVPNSLSLEKQLPCYFRSEKKDRNLKNAFINKIAVIASRFHKAGFRHRDFYLAHIFCSDLEKITLIDLHRTFKPKLCAERFRVKDIAQLNYSSCASCISQSDRMRFYKLYSANSKITRPDKSFIRKVWKKSYKMARHDIKHGRNVPFEN